MTKCDDIQRKNLFAFFENWGGKVRVYTIIIIRHFVLHATTTSMGSAHILFEPNFQCVNFWQHLIEPNKGGN